MHQYNAPSQNRNLYMDPDREQRDCKSTPELAGKEASPFPFCHLNAFVGNHA